MSVDKICPECGREYSTTYFKNMNGFLHKFYIHDDKECREIVCDLEVKEKYTGEVRVDFHERDKNIDNILSAFCPNLTISNLENIGDIWFLPVDLVVEIKTMSDLDDSMKNGDRLKKEIFNATEKHKHYIICVIGSPMSYAMSLDDYSSDDFMSRIKRIEGFCASIVARFRVENLRFFDNEFTLAYFCYAYARYLEVTHKSNKLYFIERMDIPENEETTVSMIRAVKGFETELARRVFTECKSIHDIDVNPSLLDNVKGVGPIKKQRLINAIRGLEMPKEQKPKKAVSKIDLE